MAGFNGSKFKERHVNDVLETVAGSIFQICGCHDASHDLLLVQSNAEILFMVMNADKTIYRSVAANCIRIILDAIKLRPTEAALQQLFLADSRFTNGVVEFLESCETATNLKFVLDLLKPSISAHANFISSLRNHHRIVSALQHAVAVGGRTEEPSENQEELDRNAESNDPIFRLILGRAFSSIDEISDSTINRNFLNWYLQASRLLQYLHRDCRCSVLFSLGRMLVRTGSGHSFHSKHH